MWLLGNFKLLMWLVLYLYYTGLLQTMCVTRGGRMRPFSIMLIHLVDPSQIQP